MATAREVKVAYINAHPELSAEQRDNILKTRVWIGMTTEQMKTSAIGIGAYCTSEVCTGSGCMQTWRVGDVYLMFMNGKLWSYGS